jgi:predicted DNA binding CopG/RHH family protein
VHVAWLGESVSFRLLRGGVEGGWRYDGYSHREFTGPLSKLKKLPEFRTEDEERDFWATHDATDYVDFRRARRAVLPELKPSVRTISLRLPEAMLEELKLLAHKRDVPYQSLLKMFLAERIEEELKG